MINHMLLPIGIVVFLLAAVGFVLTMYEFSYKISSHKVIQPKKSKKTKISH